MRPTNSTVIVNSSTSRFGEVPIVLIGVFFLALVSYRLFGFLLGPYEWDEMFYLHYGWWHAVKGLPYSSTPNLFDKFLEYSWTLANGEIGNIWYLRLLISTMAIVQILIVFNILRVILDGLKKYQSLTALILAIIFVATLAGFRGFEVRPEFIANTALLLAGLLLIKFLAGRHISSLLFYLVAIALVISTAASMRHVLPGVFLLSLLFVLFITSKKTLFGSLLLSCLIVFAIAYLHIIEFPVWSRIAESKEFQEARLPFSFSERLVIGGSPNHPYIVFMFASAWVYAILRYALESEKKLNENTISLCVVFFAYLSFYFFLYFFDIRPFEYVRSIEACLLFLGLATVLSVAISKAGDRQYLIASTAIMSLCFAVISVDAVNKITKSSRGISAFTQVVNPISQAEVRGLPDRDLVNLMMERKSFITQAKSRAEFCRRFPTGLAAVEDFRDHPICMLDATGRPHMTTRDFDKHEFDPSKYVFLSVPKDLDVKLDVYGFSVIAHDYAPVRAFRQKPREQGEEYRR